MDQMQHSLSKLQEIMSIRMSKFENDLQASKESKAPVSSSISQDFAEFKCFVKSCFETLQHQIDCLARDCDRLEMQGRRKILLLHGVPEERKEVAVSVASKVIQSKMKMNNFSETEIARAHRLGKSKEGKSRPLLIKFKDLAVRDKVWLSKSSLKSTGVTLSEFLTSLRHETFQAARQCFGVTKSWTHGGCVFVLGPDDVRHQIVTKADLKAIQITDSVSPTNAPNLQDTKKTSKTAVVLKKRTVRRQNRIERTASKRWRGSVRRIIAAAVYNLSCFTHGCSTGWVAGVLGSDALSGGAWLAALPCLVALPAAPIFASLADTRGRKAAVFVVALIFVLSCILAAWCGARGVWAARIAAGAGGAGSLTLAPLYCAEVAPRTRGLAALPALACSCGLVLTSVLGGCVSARALSLAMLAPPGALLLALLWLPETPDYLISVGRVQEAAKIMCWFDGSDFRQDLTDVIEQQEVHIRTSDVFHQKYDELMRQDSEMFQPMLKRSSGVTSEGRAKEFSAMKELFIRGGPRRALASCLALVLTASGSGAVALSVYTSSMLRHARHRLPALNVTAYNFTIYTGSAARTWHGWDGGAALCGAALVLGAVAAMCALEKLPRKMLLLWSCTGIAFCLATLGAYCDPRLRIYSWYIQHPWPYTLNLTRPNIVNEYNVKSHSNDSKVNIITNMSVTREVNNIVDINNVTDNVTITLLRFSVENETFDNSVMWKANTEEFQDDSEETFWLPILLISATLFLYNFGLGSVPYVLVSEFFSIQVRSLASSLLISWMWLSTFFLLRYFGTIAISLGLHATYYICATLTLLGALYIFLLIPETKGKSQQQIADDLNGPLIVFKKKRKNER